MNILHICSYYLEKDLYQNLIRALEQNHIDNKVYVPAPKLATASFELHSSVDVSYCLNKYDRLVFHYKHNKILQDFYSKYDPDSFDMIHAHSLFSNGYIAWQIYQKFNIPYIVAVRDTDLNTFFKYMLHLRGMGVEILKNAQRIVFLSEAYKAELLKRYISNDLHKHILNKSVVIPNGINEFWLKNKNKPRCLKYEKETKIITAGFIGKRKNHLTTASACQKLISIGYSIKYTIVGKIVDKTLHKKLKGNDFVQYIPNQTRDKLMNIFRDNDIFVMPSVTETFGLVYAEAMSQGLPIIYTRGQGFDKQFPDGEVGYSVDYYNVEEIAAKVIDIIEHYSDISQRCINLADKFDWNKISKEYMDIYSQINACKTN